MKILLPEFLAGTEEEEQLLKFKIQSETVKKQGQQQLTALNRITTQEAFKLNLIEEFKNALIENNAELPKVKEAKISKNNKTLVIADLHFKGTADCIDVLGSINRIIKTEKPDKIYLMGDMINGQIRPGDKFAEKMPLVKEALMFSELFTKILENNKFKGKIFYVYGNHGEIRLFGQQRQENTENIEEVIAFNLSRKFDVEHGIELVDGNTYITHGHLQNKKMTEWELPNKKINRVIRGHFHELEYFIHRDIEYITAPTCMTRLGEYEKIIGKAPSKSVLILENNSINIKKI